MNVKLFGHYVARPAAVLAALEGGLFLVALHLMSMARTCHSCYIGSVVHFELHEELLLTAVFLLITTSVGLYNRDALLDFRTFLKRFILSAQLIFIPAVAVVAITKAASGGPFGWYVGILSIVITFFMLVLFVIRLLLGWWSPTALAKKRVLVLGDDRVGKDVEAFVNGLGRSHLVHVLTVSAHGAKAGKIAPVGNLAVHIERPQPQHLPTIAEAARIDMIVVAVEDKRGLPVSDLLDCKLRGIDVVDSLTFWEREAGEIDFAHAGAGWLAFTQGFLLDARSRFIKRLADFIVSLSFVILVLPLCMFVALAIKLESPGPIFYRQERVGLNGKVFRVWKFRSMRTDAERDGVPQWANKQDNRITRVGQVIRMLRIDEIPQIMNVLSGDMSFVGPRPERPFFVEQLRKDIPHYDLRHAVKPGITGWAQVNYPYGASVDDAKRKLAYDLYYLKNHDLILDIAILMQTVRVILFPGGAR
jgi:sugar transferase (PEP-CTERM system associated)